jgi:hypothetical protein
LKDYKKMWEKLKREVQEGKDVPFCRGWIFAVMDRIEGESK